MLKAKYSAFHFLGSRGRRGDTGQHEVLSVTCWLIWLLKMFPSVWHVTLFAYRTESKKEKKRENYVAIILNLGIAQPVCSSRKLSGWAFLDFVHSMKQVAIPTFTVARAKKMEEKGIYARPKSKEVASASSEMGHSRNQLSVCRFPLWTWNCQGAKQCALHELLRLIISCCLNVSLTA